MKTTFGLRKFSLLMGTAVLFLLTLPSVSTISVVADGPVYQESFETDGEGTRYTTSNSFNDGPNDHFQRTDGSDISNVTGPYTNFDGTYFWATEDTDDDGGDGLDEKTIALNAVDISGLTNVRFQGFFGAGNESGPGASAYDAADYAIVYYSIDGGAFTKGLQFSYVDPGGGDLYNEPLAQDTDFDGNGDGTVLGTVMHEFSFTIPSGSSVVISITVSFDSANEEFAFDNFRIVGDADEFSIAKTAPDMVSPDQVFTYTIVVANSTGITTTGTVITDVVPANADFVSASDGGTLLGNTISWTILGNFADGDVVTRTFQVTATSSSGVDIVNDDYGVRAANWLTMATGSPVTTTVSPLDLIVTKTGPDYAVIGENVVYTITLNNTGVATATNVVLTDTLPTTTTYVADSSGVTPANPSTGVYVWSFGDVSSGTIRTFNLTVTVNSMPGPGGTLTLALPLTNKIEASTDTAGDDPDNNTDTWTLTACPLMLIHDIQGDGFLSPLDGRCVFIEGVVVGDFQDTSTQLRGFFVQEEEADVDADPLTSEGIFVYDYGFGVDVSVGDVVRVRGEVDEYYGLTRLGYIGSVEIYASGVTITPTAVTLPLTDEGDYEPYEGMLLVFPQDLTVTDLYGLGQYGEVLLSQGGRLFQPTSVITPGTPANNLQAANDLRCLLIDDGNSSWNPDPIIYPSPGLSATNTLRSGDIVAGITGVLDYAYGDYRLQPTTTPAFVHANPRTAAPASVGGTLRVASFNVLNYFNGDGMGGGFPTSRGADSLDEFNRQRNKIITAVLALDADVIGLMEIENDGYDLNSAIQDLVNGLNAIAGVGTYAFIDPGVIRIGTDEIAVGLLYRPGAVTPVGSAAILDSTFDPAFIDTLNRPALAQTFAENATDARFTAVVNHLKSKGSSCDAVGDPDMGDGQGNCNLTRTDAMTVEVAWLATDPTSSGDPDFLIIGDLNAYAKEDPIIAAEDAGYTNLVDAFVGADAYSYVFYGQAGYLDHALSNDSLTPQVVSATVWHINADEPRALDYNEEDKSPGQLVSLYNVDPYRASDHDPVIVGLDLIDQTALTITKSVMPSENVSPGDTVTYTITIANTGDADAIGVVITDELPPEVTFGGYVSNPGGTAQLPGPTGVITWEYPVASGASYNFVFTAIATAGTLYYDVTNTATFTSDNGGSGSDSATFTTAGLEFIYLPVVTRNSD